MHMEDSTIRGLDQQSREQRAGGHCEQEGIESSREPIQPAAAAHDGTLVLADGPGAAAPHHLMDLLSASLSSLISDVLCVASHR